MRDKASRVFQVLCWKLEGMKIQVIPTPGQTEHFEKERSHHILAAQGRGDGRSKATYHSRIVQSGLPLAFFLNQLLENEVES